MVSEQLLLNKWNKSCGYRMTTIIKFNIEKFNGKVNFSLWRFKMRAVLTHNRLKKVLGSKPASMIKEKWKEIGEKTLIAIQLCLTN